MILNWFSSMVIDGLLTVIGALLKAIDALLSVVDTLYLPEIA